jgi:hypothetical protein
MMELVVVFCNFKNMTIKWNTLPGGLNAWSISLVHWKPSNGIDSQLLSWEWKVWIKLHKTSFIVCDHGNLTIPIPDLSQTWYCSNQLESSMRTVMCMLCWLYFLNIYILNVKTSYFVELFCHKFYWCISKIFIMSQILIHILFCIVCRSYLCWLLSGVQPDYRLEVWMAFVCFCILTCLVLCLLAFLVPHHGYVCFTF